MRKKMRGDTADGFFLKLSEIQKQSSFTSPQIDKYSKHWSEEFRRVWKLEWLFGGYQVVPGTVDFTSLSRLSPARLQWIFNCFLLQPLACATALARKINNKGFFCEHENLFSTIGSLHNSRGSMAVPSSSQPFRNPKYEFYADGKQLFNNSLLTGSTILLNVMYIARHKPPDSMIIKIN